MFRYRLLEYKYHIMSMLGDMVAFDADPRHDRDSYTVVPCQSSAELTLRRLLSLSSRSIQIVSPSNLS
jgi:hypothetical protein